MKDALKNEIKIGDVVLFVETGYRNFQKGTVKSLAKQSCLIECPEDCHWNTETRRKYTQVISLTAIGKEDFEAIDAI